MPASSQVLDPIQVSFDDRRAVADAGLMLTGTLIGRLGPEQTADAKVSHGHRPGRKVLAVMSALLAGGDCIDDVDLPHAGATAKIVGHDTVAASTVGSWLRSLTFGHIRQLGLHPLVASRAGTGEILHARMRKGRLGPWGWAVRA